MVHGRIGRRNLIAGAMALACSASIPSPGARARPTPALPLDSIRRFVGASGLPPDTDIARVAAFASDASVRRLQSILNDTGPGNASDERPERLLAERRQRDLTDGAIVLVDGWVMSETEVSACRILCNPTG